MTQKTMREDIFFSMDLKANRITCMKDTTYIRIDLEIDEKRNTWEMQMAKINMTKIRNWRRKG